MTKRPNLSARLLIVFGAITTVVYVAVMILSVGR